MRKRDYRKKDALFLMYGILNYFLASTLEYG
jgi:hypothetical protein